MPNFPRTPIALRLAAAAVAATFTLLIVEGVPHLARTSAQGQPLVVALAGAR